MNTVLIITESQFDEMKKTVSYTQNRAEQKKMKRHLFESVRIEYGEAWYRMKKETRKAVETLLFSASDRGFTFIGRKSLANMRGIVTATVSRILAFLRNAGIIEVVYRRAKNGNGKGNPVLIFKDHPYFKKWISFLGLENGSVEQVNDKIDDNVETPENPIVSMLGAPKKVPTFVFTFNLLNAFKTYIQKPSSTKDVDKFNDYEDNPDKFARIANVPENVIRLLSRGYRTTEIIKLWIGIRKTLSKYGATYADFEMQVETAILSTVNKYKQFAANGRVLDFPRYLCGTIKVLIHDEILEHTKKVHEHRKRMALGYHFYETEEEQRLRLYMESDYKAKTNKYLKIGRKLGIFDIDPALPF